MKKILLTLIILAAAGVGIYALLHGQGEADSSQSAPALSKEDKEKRDKALAEISGMPLSEFYTDPDYGFSLKYPAGFIFTQFPADSENGADLLVFEHVESGLGFQIAISSFGEEVADITPERIKADIPDMVIKDPEPVNLGERGRGTTFLDGDAKAAGTMRQIWFAGNGYLYQFTSEPVFDKTMQRILSAWRFN